MVRILTFAALVAAQTSYAQQIDPAAIDKIFARYTEPGTPGCVLGVGRDGKVLYAKGYGLANLEYDVPLTSASTNPGPGVAANRRKMIELCITRSYRCASFEDRVAMKTAIIKLE